MPSWLADAVARLGADPLLQGTLAALSTFVLEDPTTIGCGLLVADGRMAFLTAFIGVSAGIALGDVGLYGIGRFFGPNVVTRGWLRQDRLNRASAWFDRNLVSAVLLSRFVPGMRLPTYLGAGVLHAPFVRFVVVAVGASVVWTLLLLSITVVVGEAILPLLGRARWPLAIAALVLFWLLQRGATRKLRLESGIEPRPGRVVSAFEFWPPWLFYIPVALYYGWLSVRYWGPMLPTLANPSIFSGGLIGESKSQILDLVPEPERRWIAPYTAFVVPPDQESADALLDSARVAMTRAGLDFPLVAKPDVGQRGAGVQPVRSDKDLRAYLESYPVGQTILLQQLVGRDSGSDGSSESAGRADYGSFREAGVLYWRAPDSDRGSIFSITLKKMPRVVGDGRSTVRELIEADPRARRIAGIYLRRHRDAADRVLPPGEGLSLVFAGNHCQGAIFRDGTHLATPELLERMHGIATAMPEFYFGRFDIRFDDLEAFLAGTGFRVIEINGAGAEATHIWDASMKMTQAYSTLFRQFRILFEIGAQNRRRGHRPLGVARFLREALAYRKLARTYPLTR